MEIIDNRAGQDVLTRLNDVPSDSASFNEGVGEDVGNFDSDASKGDYISTKIEPALEDSLLGGSPYILMSLGIGCGTLFALFIVLLVFSCRYRIFRPEEEFNWAYPVVSFSFGAILYRFVFHFCKLVKELATFRPCNIVAFLIEQRVMQATIEEQYKQRQLKTQSGKEKDTPLKKLIKQGRKLRSRLFKGSKKDPERSDNTSESAATSATPSDDEMQTVQHPTATRTSKCAKFWCKEKQPTSIPEPQPRTDSLIFENYLVDERKPQGSCFVQFQSEKPSEVQAAQNPSTRSILPSTYEITLDGLTHHPRFYNDDVVHSVCSQDSEFISLSSSDSSEMRTQNNIHPLTSSDKGQNKIESSDVRTQSNIHPLTSADKGQNKIQSSDVRTQNSVHHLPPFDRRQDKIESSENSVRQISGAGLGSGTKPTDNSKCQTVPHCSPRLLNDTPANNTKNNLISVDVSEPGAASDTELQSNSLIWQKSEENARLSYNTKPSAATERPVQHVDLHLKITSPNVMSPHEFVLTPPKGSALQKVSLHVDSDPILPIRVWTELVKNQADCVRTISDTKCHQHIEKETATMQSFSDAFICASESVWSSNSEIRRSSICKSIAHSKSNSDESFQVMLSLPGSGQNLEEKKRNVQTSLNTLQTESLSIHLGRRISATLQLKEKESSEGKFVSFNNCDHEQSEDTQREANSSDHDTKASTFQLVIEKGDGKKFTEETKPLTVHIYSPENSLNQKNDFVSNKSDLEMLLEKPPRKINSSKIDIVQVSPGAKIDIVQVSPGAKIDTRTSEKQSEASIKKYSGAFKPNLKTFKTPRISLDQLKQSNKPLVSPELSDTKKLPNTLITTDKLLKSHMERKVRKPSEKIVSETQQIRQTNFEQIPRKMTVKLITETLSSDAEHTGQTDFEQIKESPRKMSVSHPLGDYSSIRKHIRKTELKQIPRKMSAKKSVEIFSEDQSTRTTFEQIKQSPIKMSVNMAPETLLSDQTRPSSSEQIQQSPIKMSSYERAEHTGQTDFEQIKESPRKMSVIFTADTDQNRRTTPEQIKQSPRKMSVSHPLGDYSSIRKHIRKTELKQIPRKMSAKKSVEIFSEDQSTRTTFEQIKQSPIKMSVNMAPETFLSDTGQTRPSSSEQIQQSPIKMSSNERTLSRTSADSIIKDTETVLRGDHIIQSASSVSLPGDKRKSENAITLTFSPHRADVKHNGHEKNMEMKITPSNSELEKVEQKNALTITDSKLWAEYKLKLEEKHMIDSKPSTSKEEKQNTESRKGVHMIDSKPSTSKEEKQNTESRKGVHMIDSKPSTSKEEKQNTESRKDVHMIDSKPNTSKEEKQNTESRKGVHMIDSKPNTSKEEKQNTESRKGVYMIDSKPSTSKEEKQNTESRKGVHMKENVPQSSGGYDMETFTRQSSTDTLYRSRQGTGNRSVPKNFVFELKNAVAQFSARRLEEPLNVSGKHFAPKTSSEHLFLTPEESLSGINTLSIESNNTYMKSSPEYKNQHLDENVKTLSGAHWVTSNTFGGLQRDVSVGRFKIPHSGHVEKPLSVAEQKKDLVDKIIDISLESPIHLSSDYLSPTEDTGSAEIVRYDVERFESEDRIINISPSLSLPYARHSKDNIAECDSILNTEIYTIKQSKFKEKPSYLARPPIKHFRHNSLRLSSNKRTGLKVLKKSDSECSSTILSKSDFTSVGDDETKGTLAKGIDMFEKRILKDRPKYLRKPYLQEHVKTSISTEWKSNTDDTGIDSMEKHQTEHRWSSMLCVNLPEPYFHCLEDQVQTSSGTERFTKTVHPRVNTFETSKIERNQRNLPTYELKYVGDKVQTSSGTEWNVNTVNLGIDKFEKMRIKHSPKHSITTHVQHLNDHVQHLNGHVQHLNGHVQHLNDHVQAASGIENKISNVRNIAERFENMKKSSPHHVSTYQLKRLGDRVIKTPGTQWHANEEVTEINAPKTAPLKFSSNYVSRPYFRIIGDQVVTASDTAWNVNTVNSMVDTLEKTKLMHSSHHLKPKRKKLQKHVKTTSRNEWSKIPVDSGSLSSKAFFKAGAGTVKAKASLEGNADQKPIKTEIQTFETIKMTGSPKHSSKPYFTQSGDHIRTASGTEWNVNKEEIATGNTEKLRPKTSATIWKTSCLKRLADDAQSKSVPTYMSKPYFAHLGDQSRYTPGTEIIGSSVPIPIDKYEKVKFRGSQRPVSAPYVEVTDQPTCLSRSHFKHLTRPYFTHEGDHIRTISGTEWNANKKDIIESLKPKTITSTWRKPRLKYLADDTQSKSVPSFLSKPYFAHLGDENGYTPGTEIIGSSVPIPIDKYEKVKVRGSQRPVSAPYVEATDQPPCLSRPHFKHLTRPYFTQEGDHIRTISGTEWNANREDIASGISEIIKPKTSARTWKTPRLKYLADHTQPKSVPTFLSKPYIAHSADQSIYAPGFAYKETVVLPVTDKYKNVKVRENQTPVSASYVEVNDQSPRSHFKHFSRPYFTKSGDHIRTISGTEWNVNKKDIIESLKPKTITSTWRKPRLKYLADHTQSKSVPSFLSKPYFAHLGDENGYTPGTEIIGSSVSIPIDKYEKVKVRGSQRPVSAPYVEATDQPPCLSRSHFKHLTRPYFTQEGDHIRTISGTEWNANREDIASAVSEIIKPKTSARIWKKPRLKYLADHTQPKSVPTDGDQSRYTPGTEFVGTTVPNKYKKAKVRDSQRPVSVPYVKAPDVLPSMSRPHLKNLRDYFQTSSGTECNVIDAGIDIFERAKSVGNSKYLTKPHFDTFDKINSKRSPPKLRQYSKPLKDITRTDTDLKTSPIKQVIKSFEQGMINIPLKKNVNEEKITSTKTDWKEKQIKFEPEAFSGNARTFSGTQIAPDTVRRGIDIFQQKELKRRQRHLSRHFIRLLGNTDRAATKPKCIQKTVQSEASEAKLCQFDDYEPRIKIKPWGVVRDASLGDVMRTTSNTTWTANTVNRGIEKFEAPFPSVHIRTRSVPWDATKLVKQEVTDSEVANGKQTEPTISPSKYSQLTENVSSKFKTQMEPEWKVNSEKKINNFSDQYPPKIIKRWAVFRDAPSEGFLRTTSDTIWNANVVRRGIDTFNAPFPSRHHRLTHSGANIPLNIVEKGVNNFELAKNARANVLSSPKYNYKDKYRSEGLKVPPSQYKPRLFPEQRTPLRHGYGEHYFKGKKPGIGEMPVYRSQGLQRIKPFFTIYPHFFGLSQNCTDKLKMMQKLRDFRNTFPADNVGKVLPWQRSGIDGNHSNSCQEGSPKRHRISSVMTLFDAKSRHPICRLRQKSVASDFRTRQLKPVPFPKSHPLQEKDEQEVSRQMSRPDQNFSASGTWKVKRGPRSFQIPLDKHMQSRQPGCPSKGDAHRKICSSVPQQHRSSTIQLCSEVSHCSLNRGRIGNSALLFDAKSGLFCHRSQTPGIRICQHRPTISLESLPYKIAIRGDIRRETLQQQSSDTSHFQSESSHSWLDRSPFRQVSSLRSMFEAKCRRFIHDLKSEPYSPQTPLTYRPVSTSPKSFSFNQAYNQHLSPRASILTASRTPELKYQQYSNNSQSNSIEENAPNH